MHLIAAPRIKVQKKNQAWYGHNYVLLLLQCEDKCQEGKEGRNGAIK